MTLKKRFMKAVSVGELGKVDDFGVTVSLKEFKFYFRDVKSDYINSFLPAAVIEPGQYSATHTKYLFRVRKGMYRIHPDAVNEQQDTVCFDDISLLQANSKVEEAMKEYNSYRVG